MNFSELNQNYVNIKCIFFVLLFFPFLMHIHWHLFDLLYLNDLTNIIWILVSFSFFVSFYEKNHFIVMPTDKWLIFIFILFLLVNSILLKEFKDFMKYAVYFYLYIVLYRSFEHRIYFNIFINIVVFFSFISMALFFISLFSDFYHDFKVSNLSFVANNDAFAAREDWEYTLPFYLSVFPMNSYETSAGITGIPRFFGLSTEPGSMSVVVLPTMLMAVALKKYFSVIILFIALIISSSYAFLFLFVFGILLYCFFNYKRYIFMITGVSLVGVYYFDFLSLLQESTIHRVASYSTAFNNVSLIKITLFASKDYIDFDKAIIGAGFDFLLKYGLLSFISYLGILLYKIFESNNVNNKIVFIFTIIFIISINKSGEIISPLFLFYMSFVNYFLKVNDSRYNNIGLPSFLLFKNSRLLKNN